MIGSAIPRRRRIRPRVLKFSGLAGWRYTNLDEEEKREGLHSATFIAMFTLHDLPKMISLVFPRSTIGRKRRQEMIYYLPYLHRTNDRSRIVRREGRRKKGRTVA